MLVFAAVLCAASTAHAGLRGHNAPKQALRTAPLPKPSGWLWIYAENTREELHLNIYNEDGSYNMESLAKLDHMFRDLHRNEVKAVDPHLYEILSIIADHFGQKRILFGSGFRVERMTSRHFNGSACDFRIEGVGYKTVYEFAKTLDMGGMGLGQYPTSQFVHVDYRAPGEPSFWWTDDSGPSRKKSKPASGPKVKRSDKPNT
jgi:uncharacterized protein YcbK (DUF882 family)